MKTNLYIRILVLTAAVVSLVACGDEDKSVTPPAATDTTAPAQTQNVQSVAVTANAVTLNWTAPGNDDSVGTAAAYDVRYRTDSLIETLWAAATQATGEPTPQPAGTAESFTVTGLSPATSYTFAMKTVDQAGNWSPLSNVTSITTTAIVSDSIPPGAVSDLVILDVTARTSILSWTMTGDDGTTGTAAAYSVRYSTSPINQGNWDQAVESHLFVLPPAAGSMETDTISGLDPHTTYYFAIRVKDDADLWSPVSNNATSATLIGGFDFGMYGFYTFGSASTYIASFAVTDLQDDGDLDIIVADGRTDRAIHLGLNSGTGLIAFTKSLDLRDPDNPAPFTSYWVAVAAAKGVGPAASYTSIVAGFEDPNQIAYFQNRGGNFDSLTVGGYDMANLGLSHVPRILKLADMDGDGDADILTAGPGSQNVAISWNSNAYNVIPPTLYYAAGTPVDMAVANFDGDGTLDFATVIQEFPTLRIQFSGSGSFVTRSFSGLAPSVTAADLDGDAQADLVVVSTDSVFIFRSGGGAFTDRQSFYVGQSPRNAACADFDLDGDIDIVVSFQEGLYFLANVGGGVFERADRFSLFIQTASLIQTGDFDLDGDQDILVRAQSRTVVGSLRLYRFTNYRVELGGGSN